MQSGISFVRCITLRFTVWISLSVLAGCTPTSSSACLWQRPYAVRLLGDDASGACHIERHVTQAMGTAVTFVAWTQDGAAAQNAFAKAAAEIVRLERLMTTWPHADWPASDIMRLNAQAGEAAVAVSEETYAVLESAQCMAKLSAGRFDVTIGALDGIWHFHDDLRAEVPSPTSIATQLASVDYKLLLLDRQRRTAQLKARGMRVNLGGIAKGYAVDRALEILHKEGLKNVVIQAGGDMYASGQRGDKPWRVGIRDPRGMLVDDVLAHLHVRDRAVSTAGDYERGFDVQGQRYHHILDPRTGFPSPLCQSVTVVAPSAWLADAIDDVVFLMGPQEGLQWIRQFDEVDAVVVDKEGRVHLSDRLQKPQDHRDTQVIFVEMPPRP